MKKPMASATTKRCIAVSWIISAIQCLLIFTRWKRGRLATELKFVVQSGATIPLSIDFSANFVTVTFSWVGAVFNDVVEYS